MGIFRYRRASEYLYNEIVGGELFFNPVVEMNDYYDGFLQRSLEGNVEEYINFCSRNAYGQAKQILSKGQNKTSAQKDLEIRTKRDTLQWAKNILNVPGYLEESIQQLRIDFESNPSKIKNTLDIQNKNLNTMRQKIFICCFSKKKLDISMFGYYSENGTGIMLEYADTKNITREINYVETLPVIPLYSTFEELVSVQVFTKLNCWSHEKEIRAYIYDTKQKNTNHGMRIKTVYIGPSTENNFADKIIHWSKEANVEVKSPMVQDDGSLFWQWV